MRVVGIDPGHARIGYGVIEVLGGSFHFEEMGVWEITSHAPSTRLAELETRLTAFLRSARPDRIGIERLFFSTNKRTAMAVSEARGVILLAAGKTGIPLIELTPNEVKQAVTGDGSASKSAVAKMVRWILHLEDRGGLDDETDALAIAIAAAGSFRTFPKGSREGG
ncbi:MAG: crossover junction endodeoxyribonuclease RuvC [Candidatus Jorgensenbacteria bacterium]|nr:crossover junction endodeoxyribonuclease RuvC [Candidatus Jorgensenbacteria bacterium]